MTVYIILVILIFVSHGIVNKLDMNDNTKKKVFLIFTGLLFILLASLRHESVGADTSDYWLDYEVGRSATFKEVITNWGENKAYYWLNGIFSRTGAPIQVWFGFLGLAAVGPVFYLIYKYSDNLLFSVLLYLIVGTYMFTLAGLKQTVAMTFLIFAFVQVVNRKPLLFLLFVAIATFFHQTSIVFIIVYPLAKIKSLQLQTVLYSAMTLLAFFNAVPILQTVIDFLDNEHYESYLNEDSQYSLVSFSIQLLMLLVCLLYSKNSKTDKHTQAVFFTISFLGIAMQAYASSFASLFRLSVYFNNGLIILMPNSIKTEPNNNYRRILEWAAMAVFISYYVYSLSQGTNYKFFWQ